MVDFSFKHDFFDKMYLPPFSYYMQIYEINDFIQILILFLLAFS